MDEEQKRQFLLRLIQAQERAIEILDDGYETIKNMGDQIQINSIRNSLQK